MNESSLFPASSPALLSVVLLILDRLAGVYEASSCFDSHFPSWQAWCIFFEIFLRHFFCLLLRTLSSGLRPIFLNEYFGFAFVGGSYCHCFLSSSYILDINPTLDSVCFFFTNCFFSCAEDFGFHEVPLKKLIVLNSWANGIIVRKSFSTTIPCRLQIVFPSRSFCDFDLTLRSLTHLESVFVRGGRYRSNFILLRVVNQFSQHYLLKLLPVPWCFLYVCLLVCFGFGASSSNIRWLQLSMLMLGSSVLTPGLHSLSLHVWLCGSTVLFLLLWLCNVSWGLGW